MCRREARRRRLTSCLNLGGHVPLAQRWLCRCRPACPLQERPMHSTFACTCATANDIVHISSKAADTLFGRVRGMIELICHSCFLAFVFCKEIKVFAPTAAMCDSGSEVDPTRIRAKLQTLLCENDTPIMPNSYSVRSRRIGSKWIRAGSDAFCKEY